MRDHMVQVKTVLVAYVCSSHSTHDTTQKPDSPISTTLPNRSSSPFLNTVQKVKEKRPTGTSSIARVLDGGVIGSDPSEDLELALPRNLPYEGDVGPRILGLRSIRDRIMKNFESTPLESSQVENAIANAEKDIKEANDWISYLGGSAKKKPASEEEKVPKKKKIKLTIEEEEHYKIEMKYMRERVVHQAKEAEEAQNNIDRISNRQNQSQPTIALKNLPTVSTQKHTNQESALLYMRYTISQDTTTEASSRKTNMFLAIQGRCKLLLTKSNDKTETQRPASPYRCHSCNRTETPEWRRGPDGPRTLCNACGLRWYSISTSLFVR